MNRISENRKGVKKWINCWSLESMKKYQEHLKKNSQCTMAFNGDMDMKLVKETSRFVLAGHGI